MTTPPIPRLPAASVRIPPQQETSTRPSLAMTSTSPLSAASMAAAAMCCAGPPAAVVVRARPATGVRTGQSGLVAREDAAA